MKIIQKGKCKSTLLFRFKIDLSRAVRYELVCLKTTIQAANNIKSTLVSHNNAVLRISYKCNMQNVCFCITPFHLSL